MPRRKHTAEEIINKLREAEVIISSCSTVVEAVRHIGVSEQTFYRWRSEYGGLRVDQARRLKQLETENSRLKRGTPKSAYSRVPSSSRHGKEPSPTKNLPAPSKV